MTREEAIELLKDCPNKSVCGHYNFCKTCYGCKLKEAIDMAIKSLNDELNCECPQNDTQIGTSDLISRAEVHKVLSLLATEGGKDAKLLFSDAHESIDNLPSVKPIVNNRDLISRSDAMDEVQKHFAANGFQGYIDEQKMMYRINNLPSVSADRPSGEWQRVDEQPYFRKHYHKVCCSVCHKQGSEKYNYCPNCGAKMKEE